MQSAQVSSKPVVLSVSAVLVAMVSIQSGASVAKYLFPAVGPQGATALRLTFAALMLAILWKPWRARLDRKALKSIALYGVALGLMNLTFYIALERLPLGIAVALEFTGPLAVAVFASRKPLDFLWALFAISGVALILPITPGSAALDPVGVLFALGAGFFWALYIVFGQKAGSTVHGGTATALGMAVAAICAIPFGVAQGGAKLFDPSLLPLALAVGFFSSALPYSLEMIALKRLRTQTFGILMSLEPAIGALSGLFFWNERLTFTQWLAITFVIVASFGSSVFSRR